MRESPLQLLEVPKPSGLLGPALYLLVWGVWFSTAQGAVGWRCAAGRGGRRSPLRAVGVWSSTAVAQGLRERLTELILVNV